MKSLLALCLCACALAGLLVPKTSHPVTLSYNNQQTTSSYTFKIQIETSVPATGLLVIYFPNNFASGLGVATCSTQDEQGNSYSCTISGTAVTISPGYLSNSPVDNTYTFKVNGVMNPTSTGMTGHFRMETYSGANLLDYCDMFGQIGIDSSAVTLTSTMFACMSGCLTGQVGLYQVAFSSPTALPPYARVFLTFPNTISMQSPPPCVSTTQSYVTCSKDSTKNLVTLGSLYYTLPANTLVAVTFSNVQNPSYAGSIGTLTIEIFQPLVNSLIGVASGVSGPVISPNAVTGVVVCPNDANPCTASQPNVALNNRMVFTVTAATTNSIPANGSILVTFPASFGTMETGTCQITSGLNNLGATASTQVTCTVNDAAKQLTISNFALFPSGSFSLQVRVTTPLVAGVASYFNVFTYQDVGMTKLIDLNQNTATTSIANIVTTNNWNMFWYDSGLNLVTSFSSAAQLTLKLVFRPNVSITTPASSSIQMKFPTGFTIGASTSVILMPNQYAAQQTLAGVSFGSNVFGCPFTSVGYTIPNNEDTQIVVNGVDGYFQMPTTPGMYPIEMILQNYLAGSITTTAFMYWISVTAPPMVTVSASALTVDINKMTVYTISLTPTLAVPSSVIPVNTATAWGAIDVQFPTQDTNLNTLWAIDLGTGLTSGSTLPCLALSNMSVVSGSAITCTLYPAASVGAGLYATVRVTNFQSLPVGTSVSFTIANIANGQTGGVQPSLTIVTYSIIQSFMQPLNSNSNVQIPVSFYDDGSTALPVINGRSPSPNGDGANVVQFTPNTLNVATTLTFILWLETGLTAGVTTTGLIIKMPMTYPIPYSGVACYLSYTISATCYTYPACGWIVFTPLPVAVGNLATHMNYQVTITGLTNPINRITSTSLSITPAQGNHESEYIYFTNFTPLNLGAVSSVSIAIDNYQANSVDTTYTFGFTLTDNLAVGSTVVITFPQNSYVLTTVPSPSCSISGGLNALSSTQPILCSYTANTVTISQFTNYVGGNAISVRIQHILNPLNAGMTDTFNIESFSQAGLLEDGNYSIPGVVILDQSIVPVLTHNNFWAVPSNGYATGVLLTVSITPSISIPAQSVIKIVYPLEYTPIPSVPVCTLSGALTTLLSCSSDGNTVLRVTTDTKYDISSTQAPLNITLAGIKNFAPGITSGIVTVSIFCSNQLITESSTDPFNRKFTTDLQTSSLSVKSFDFDPQTAGEEAMYNFTIALTTSFLGSCTVNVQFPNSVPRGLNQFVGCMSTELSAQTNREMDCYVSGRTVVINGTAGWTQGTSSPLVNLTIRRITNPSVGGRLDIFTVYTKCGNMIVDIGTLQSAFVFAAYPAAMYYQNSTISSNACGYSSSLYLQVKTSTTASLPDDRWLVTFPPAYTMKYIANQLLCTSNETVVSPAQSTYYMNQIGISAFNSVQSVSGFEFGVQGIENPYVVGDIPYLVTSWHEPSTRKVLAKTASNLNRVLPFTFQKIGKDILVNYDLPWTVELGTWSDQMYVTLQANSPADFTLSPISIPGITVIPNPISFSLGDSFQGFHMSAAQSVVPGSYNMSWTVAGTWTQSIYAPVKRSFFTVQSLLNENITIQSPGVIPQGGSSVPLAVVLTRPPASGLKLSLVQLGSIPTKMNFTSSVLSFAPGETVKSFHILISNESYGTEGEFLVFKSGQDAASYQLGQSSYTFQVGKPTANKPIVLEAKVVSISRNSVLIRMLTNSVVKVFYMTGYYGTRAPTQQEFSEGSFKNSTLIKWMPWFNSTTTYLDQTTQYQYSITLDGLTAQTRYTFYAEIQDDINNIGASLVNFNFTTSSRFNPAYCTMKFLQSPLGDSFRGTISQNVASVLGIKSTLVQVIASLTDNSTAINSTSVSSDAPLSTTSTGGSRLLVSVSYATVYILSDPTVPSDTEPVQLVVSLNNLRLKLKALMPTFDDTIQISAKKLTASAPAFFLQAKFASTTNGVLVLNNLSLMQNGFIYLCFVQATLTPVTPTSYQIFQGVDAGNTPCWLSDSVSASATPIDYTKTGLPDNANFWVFLTASNWLTLSPELLPDTQVVSLGFTTRGTFYNTTVTAGSWIAITFGFVLAALI